MGLPSWTLACPLHILLLLFTHHDTHIFLGEQFTSEKSTHRHAHSKVSLLAANSQGGVVGRNSCVLIVLPVHT